MTAITFPGARVHIILYQTSSRARPRHAAHSDSFHFVLTAQSRRASRGIKPKPSSIDRLPSSRREFKLLALQYPKPW